MDSLTQGRLPGTSMLFKSMLMLVCFFCSSQTFSVVNSQVDDPYLRLLNYSSELPKGLVEGRSVVFVLLEEENPGRVRWKSLSSEAHQVIVGTGTDIVGYYNIKDVFAGLETQKYFAEDLVKREIDNIFILEKGKNFFTLKVTAFNKKASFIDHGQQAWISKQSDLSAVLADYRRAVGNSGQKRANFLMSDYPEFFEDTRMIRSRRFEVYNRDLKLDKLAVAMFQKILLPAGNQDQNSEELKKINQYRENWKRDSMALVNLMQEYPFEYGVVNNEIDEEKLRNSGYQFILYYLHTGGKAIHELLNYNNDMNVTDYITIKNAGDKPELITIPANTQVYKFYIKHIYSGEIYLGESWDAEESWQAALGNHINGIKTKVK